MHGVSAVFHLKLIATEDVDPEQRIRQMRIFLTGASGSIGRVVTERALAEGSQSEAEHLAHLSLAFHFPSPQGKCRIINPIVP